MAAQTQTMAVPTDAELLKAQADLWRHSLYYLTSMALKCAVELGIPAAIHRLGGGSTLPDLISTLSLPASKQPYLHRLMRLLATSGIFTTDNTTNMETYRLTPVSFLLVDDIPADNHTSQTALVVAATSRHCLEASLGLANWFKKEVTSPSSPFEEVHGAALFDESMTRLCEDSDRLFNQALAAHDNFGIGIVLQECRGLFEGVQSLTDCCGGDGTTAAAIVKAFPHIKCTVLDLPRVIDTISKDSAINFIGGDMFKFIPPAQAVLLKLVLHHWSDEDCIKILSQCKKAIPSREEGGKVIVIDIVVGPASGTILEAQLLMDIAMMVNTRGRQRDENDWRSIVMKAGFSECKIVKMLGARGVFEIYP
ncbi:hypothetical protein PR202_gb16081 [Eleusine coracana subsp. coracana]|uniref:Uncharacterized protein n=1 Tax=Eleusine coracana subsp. coracana TaxID=191504 RepID=A0AAV5EXA3_ELECO|nr:hypothetical protein QOZ80_9BG0702970 [Eleusine coracana subsp. coracana]GJN28003.1 hypothetical protein PR202_gb16081 [Eleusine coracana subsp. coracana]